MVTFKTYKENTNLAPISIFLVDWYLH